MNKRKMVLAVFILSAIIMSLYGIGHTNFSVKESKNIMPKIVDIIIIDGYHSALCVDGTVWCWEGKQKDAAKQMSGLKNVKKITAAYVGIKEWFMTDVPTGIENSVLYALSEDGYIYAWGYNNPCLISTEREDWFLSLIHI